MLLFDTESLYSYIFVIHTAVFYNLIYLFALPYKCNHIFLTVVFRLINDIRANIAANFAKVNMNRLFANTLVHNICI